MDEFTLLVTGALLHDIGKFVQRANWLGRVKESHEIQGEEYLRKKFFGTEFEKIHFFARYHHEKSLGEFRDSDKRFRNLLEIVCEADSISSTERDEGEVLYGTPLRSIFSSVRLNSGGSALYYYPAELDPGKINYPAEKKELKYSDYEQVFEKFDNTLSKILQSFNPDKLLMVLEKYTSFVPSKMSIENDISLFDHLKSTAALASCLYYYHLNELDENPNIKNRDEKKYLFVGGDLSGIQEFIYNVTSKGALKYLRARSAFLEFLTHDVAIEVIERLNLTFANIVYVGGGNFYLLLPNTEKAKEVIMDVKREVNSWLLKNYGGDVYLSMAYVEADGNSVMRMKSNEVSLWDAVNAELKEDKQKKFYDTFGEEWWVASKEYRYICKVCGRRTDSELKHIEEKDVDVCDSCYSLWHLGDGLLKAEVFVRSRDEKDIDCFEVSFSKIYVCSVAEVSEFSTKSILFVKNCFDPLDHQHRQLTYLVSDYAIRSGERGGVKSFDSMEAVGAKKIALLKMDVDNLGKIFSEGIENNSLSRSSMLSRMLNLFFKAHLNSIVRSSHDLDTPKIRKSVERRELVVIYSGGDDLVIGGSWNDVFESAFEIREFFRKYTGYNQNITISGGYGIFDEKTPMIRMAKLVSLRLEIAKEEGKDRIYLMDRNVGNYKNYRSYVWDGFIELWNKYAATLMRLNGKTPEEVVPRSLIYKLIEAREAYVKDERSPYWFISPMYHLSRRKGEEKKIFGSLFKIDPERTRKNVPQEIFFIDVPLKFVDLALRR